MASERQSAFGLAGIFDNVRDGLVLVRFPQREIVLFNLSAAHITGIPSHKAIGARLDTVFPDAAVQATADHSSSEPVGAWPGHAQGVLRTRIPGHDGHEQDVELHFCRVDDVGMGGPLVLLVVRPSDEALQDVAAQRAVAQRRVDQLEADGRERALLFGEAAHEFNTPLTIVALQAQLLRGALGPVGPDQERAFSIINANVHRLVLLSQDLMDLARADAGRLALHQEPLDLVQLALDELANFQALAAQQGVTLQLERPASPVTVPADAARLRQVVSNFLGNAIKFTPSGGRVTLEVQGDASQGSIRIRDTGPGMDAADLARLFRPFARIDTPGATAKPGTGLGLYLSKRIVEAHGGRVGCASPGRGQGMTFWLEMPTEPTSPPARGRRRRPTPGERGGTEAAHAKGPVPPRAADAAVPRAAASGHGRLAPPRP